VQLDTFIYWYEIVVVTFDGRVLFCKDLSWQWEDCTEGIAPATPIDVTVGWDGYYVVTDEGSVFRSLGLDPTGVPEVPASLDLVAAPNPFNPQTVLSFWAPEAGRAQLEIYDVAGRLVDTVLKGMIAAGPRQVVWRPRELGSGLYVARLRLGRAVETQEVILLK
jgi:hypothetical protein